MAWLAWSHYLIISWVIQENINTCQERADVCGHEHVEGFVEAVDGAGEEGADGGAHRASPVDDRRHSRQRLRGPAQARVRALGAGKVDI